MNGAELIAQERQRQIEKEGWTAEHDSKFDGHLAIAAACYAVVGIEGDSGLKASVNFIAYAPIGFGREGYYIKSAMDAWPFGFPGGKWDKRKKHNRLRRLQIAGALIAAEIDRLLAKGGRDDWQKEETT